MAEIEHMLEVWRLEAGGSLVSEGLRPVPRSVYQQMVCLTRISTELQVCKESSLLQCTSMMCECKKLWQSCQSHFICCACATSKYFSGILTISQAANL